MKLLKPALTVVILLGALVCSNAWAGPGHHGGHWRHGYHGHPVHVVISTPVYWAGYGDPYYDPYSPRYVVEGVYVPPAPAFSGPPAWYYCGRPRGYYPQVRTCRVPWRAGPAPLMTAPPY